MEKAREAYWRDCETDEKTIHSIATALREAEARGRASMKEDAAAIRSLEARILIAMAA
jgi:hypothetical protein